MQRLQLLPNRFGDVVRARVDDNLVALYPHQIRDQYRKTFRQRDHIRVFDAECLECLTASIRDHAG